MAQGYHQVPLSEEVSKKMYFVTPDGQHQYITMPYGLTTAPAVFQRLTTHILKGLPTQNVFFCIDATSHELVPLLWYAPASIQVQALS